LAVGDIAHFRVIVPDPIRFKFSEELSGALLIEMLDAASAVGCDYLEPFRLDVQQLGHERTSAIFKVAQNPHFVGKTFFGLRSAKRLMHSTVIPDANLSPESVLDLVHFSENMAHEGAQASFEERSRVPPPFLFCFSSRILKEPSIAGAIRVQIHLMLRPMA